MPDIVEIEIRYSGEPQIVAFDIGFRGPPGPPAPGIDALVEQVEVLARAVAEIPPPYDDGPVMERIEAVETGATAMAEAQAELQAEIAAARGGRSSLSLRLATISDFASPNAGQAIPGRYYDNAFHGAGAASYNMGQRRLELAPFYTSQRFAFDNVGVLVQTPLAGAVGRIYVYSATAEGWPDGLLFESADLSLAQAGFVAFVPAVPFVFEQGRTYWLGFRLFEGGVQLRAVPTSSCVNLGLVSPDATQYNTIVRRALSSNLPAPNPWRFTETDLVGNVTPVSIRMRAVA